MRRASLDEDYSGRHHHPRKREKRIPLLLLTSIFLLEVSDEIPVRIVKLNNM
jgi:hypothetical protein